MFSLTHKHGVLPASETALLLVGSEELIWDERSSSCSAIAASLNQVTRIPSLRVKEPFLLQLSEVLLLLLTLRGRSGGGHVNRPMAVAPCQILGGGFRGAYLHGQVGQGENGTGLILSVQKSHS